jgi:hypothetical protein
MNIHVTARCGECSETFRVTHVFAPAELRFALAPEEIKAEKRAALLAQALDVWLDHSDTHASRSVLLTIKETP